MATTVQTTRRLQISAPDAATAFALERRLAHLHPVAVGRGADWRVELEDSDDRLDEITAAVAHWLRDIGADTTEITVDGLVKTVESKVTDDEPLGAGYDAAYVLVLEHEP
jgi:hypothetical protein